MPYADPLKHDLALLRLGTGPSQADMNPLRP